MSLDNYVHRFLLEELDIRGAIVRLGSVWRAMQERRNYPVPVRQLVGQMASITAVIAGNLKQPGRLTIQLQGHGPTGLLVVDCDETLNIRGYARADAPASGTTLGELVGDGHLMLTLDVAGLDKPYQSYVPLEGNDIADVFKSYLLRSEQQATGIWLAADENVAACLFLQKLPAADLKDADGWTRALQLASTVSEAELLREPAQLILQRLFHEETVRVFEPREVRHEWPEDRDKVATMLRSLGREEVDRLVTAHGEVRIQDELSNHEYVFTTAEVNELFAHPPTLQ